MKKILLILWFSICFSSAMAYDPAVFNFSLFLKVNDKDHDGYLSEEELLNADMERSYHNALTKPINTKEAFEILDKDRDGKLSLEELWWWGRYQVNGCEGWPWR